MSGLKYPLQHLPMLGKGSILIDRFDASGNPSGYQPIGNATKFELDLKDDRAELYSSLNKNVTLIATALKKRQPTLSITGTDFRSDVAALFLMSTGKTSLAVAAGAITGEQIASATVSKKGKYFGIVSRGIDVATPPVVHQGTATLVEGTDYVIADPLEGLFYFPSTSAVDDTKVVTVDYSTLVGSFDQVAGGTIPTLQGRLRFVPDPTDGQKIGVEVWRVNLSPNGQVGFIADDYGNWTLDGFILDDTVNHPDAPFYLATFY